VGHEQRCRSCNKFRELVIESSTRDRIKRGERFVEQQERRLSHEGARQCDSTTLPARNFRRVAA
jgi:hypothetical protein